MYPGVGGESMMTPLLDANPRHRHVIIFSAGVVLEVPVVDPPRAKNLPPWKRR